MYYSKLTGGFYTAEIHGDNIPTDAVEISDDEHIALIEAQSQGKNIYFDEKNKKPIAKEPPALSASAAARIAIAALESSITPRRMREAILGTDNGWLADVEAQIEVLRGSL